MHGIGHFNPSNEITNQFLEDLDIGTSDQWILDRVGIRSRRTVLPLEYIRETRNAEPREAMEAAHSGVRRDGEASREGVSRCDPRQGRCPA